MTPARKAAATRKARHDALTPGRTAAATRERKAAARKAVATKQGPAAIRKAAAPRRAGPAATKGFVIPAGGGRPLDLGIPGRSAALKLIGTETAGSIMLFEETIPAGFAVSMHLHHDSDEIAWVIEGELSVRIGEETTSGGPGTCVFFPRNVPHAWKNTGRGTARAIFLYTPAAAGRFFETLQARPPGPVTEAERQQLFARFNWKIVGPDPF